MGHVYNLLVHTHNSVSSCEIKEKDNRIVQLAKKTFLTRVQNKGKREENAAESLIFD